MNFHGVQQWPPLATLLLSLLLCAALLMVARIAAKRIGLVDKPSERKHHNGHIPLVGGASIFITFALFQFGLNFSVAVIVAGGLLLLVGMADDYIDLSPLSRLLFQSIAAGILVIGGGYQISSIGSLVGDHTVVLSGFAAIVFSVICVIGVVNAINMIDGADGLAGGIVSISIAALLFISFANGADDYFIAGLLTVLGATSAFLAFNTGRLGSEFRVFLGDSGSMFLGILLASYYIGMSQGESAYMNPVVAGWIFGLPLMDSISVMVGRAIKGKSPLKAGRDHLHHRLMDTGMSQVSCVLGMLVFHSALVIIGLLGNQYDFPMPVLFWGFVALTIAYHFLAARLIDQFCLRRVNRRARASRYSS